MPPTPDAAKLAAAIAALPVAVERATCELGAVALPDYPDGPRPTAEVRFTGGGHVGRGEHVAFTALEHRGLRDALPGLLPSRGTTVGAWSAELTRGDVAPHARATLEAAAIDLALRQAGTNLFALAGVRPESVRYVVSLDARAEPLVTAARGAAAAPRVELKLDVATGWDERLWRALAITAPIAILDWKGGGTSADHARAHTALPDALHEDPSTDAFPEALAAWRACDASVLGSADVAALRPRPAAVNVKPARVGGVLEALAVVAACGARGIPVYLGGMWEVGAGRAQLHVLAALFSPEGPNDVAPLGRPSAPVPRRLRVSADAAGFGGS